MTDYGTPADHVGLAAADPSGLTSASGRCDVIVNNGMGEPTECGRTLPCQYHGPEAEGLRVALDRGLEAIRDTSSDPKSRQLAKSLIAALAATPPASGPLTSGSHEPEGLDVERLARSLLAIDAESTGYPLADYENDDDLAIYRANAKHIAAEYARLANEEGET